MQTTLPDSLIPRPDRPLSGPQIVFKIEYNDDRNLQELDEWIARHQIASQVRDIRDLNDMQLYWHFSFELPDLLALLRSGLELPDLRY
jgi:hypothetical protein